MAGYYAKSDGRTTVAKHLEDVAFLAGEYGRDVGMPGLARTAGWLHDTGKYGEAFQDVLSGKRTGVDHACPSAALAYYITGGKVRQAYEAIAAHHSRLENLELLEPTFQGLLKGKLQGCPSGRQASLTGFDKNTGRGGFAEALRLLKSDFPGFKPEALEIRRFDFLAWKGCLDYMLSTRMLFSCLVDADYTASAAESVGRDAGMADGDGDRDGPDIRPEDALIALENYRTGLGISSEASYGVCRLRNRVYFDCMRAGQDAGNNFFTLTAPTGSGKTLGMLKFALERCRADRTKKRVIFVLPYLTISDQVEDVVREIIPDAVIDNSQTGLDESQRETAARWSAPCVVTTTVQFFQSLFSDRPGDCRKLHRIANSVILLDEVQALPVGLSRVLIQTLNLLAREYNSCICLSTATQPAYDYLPGLDFSPKEIIEDKEKCFRMVERTGINFNLAPRGLESVADEALDEHDVCVITNLRAHARTVYERWKSKGTEDIFLLSTDLCGLHRRDVLREIKRRQSYGRTAHVAATQCIEAGVDLDFGMVYRALAPLWALIQAAGRCNRNGKLFTSRCIRIFEPDEKHKYPDAEYERQALLVKVLLASGEDLNSLGGIEVYYKKLFAGLREPEGLVRSLTGLDYQGAAKATALIARSGYRVIVPYDELIWHETLDAVRENRVSRGDLRRTAGLSVPSYDLNAVERHCQELVLRNRRTGRETRTGTYILLPGHESCYDSRTGLRLSGDGVDDMYML